MARDPRIALDDMVIAINRIAEETGNLTFAQFAENWRVQYIVERALLIISEASRAIPESSKEKHVEIRWVGVRDIGNVIRHQYASLSPSLIWNVVRDELPRLQEAISAIRRELEAQAIRLYLGRPPPGLRLDGTRSAPISGLFPALVNAPVFPGLALSAPLF